MTFSSGISQFNESTNNLQVDYCCCQSFRKVLIKKHNYEKEQITRCNKQFKDGYTQSGNRRMLLFSHGLPITKLIISFLVVVLSAI